MQSDVLVVGAGPTGLALAHELARRGVRCRIIDRSPVPAGSSRAVMLYPRALEALALMGLAEEICAAGHRVGRGVIRDTGGTLAVLDFGTLPTAFPFVLTVPQQVTERILLGALARLGVQVERGTKLVDLAPDERGVVAQLSDGRGHSEALRTAWVVGCDGAHSTVRHLIDFGLDLGPADPEETLLADVSLEAAPAADGFEMQVTGGRWLGIVPLPEGRWRVVAESGAIEPVRRGRRRVGDANAVPDLAEIGALLENRFSRRLQATHLHWSATLRTDRRLVRRLRRDRVFLAGEAARVCGPALGQGINAGIQDALNLGWKLAQAARGAARPELLDSYEAERLPAQPAAQDELERLLPDAPPPLLLRWLRRLLPRRPDAPAAPLGQRLTAALAGIPTGATAQPATLGARAPDVACTRLGDGARLRVFQLLEAGACALVLVNTGAGDPALVDRVVRLWRGAAWQEGPADGGPERRPETIGLVGADQGYGRRPSVCVVRPDGCLAVRCALRDAPVRLGGFLALANQAVVA